MSLNLKDQSLNIKSTGRAATVPDNKLAKLMAYLKCVLVLFKLMKVQD